MTVFEPSVAHVFAMPVLSLPLTVIRWTRATQRPATSAPAAATVGAVGSSIVTTVEAVWNAAPGWQLGRGADDRLLQRRWCPPARANDERLAADVQAGDRAAAVRLQAEDQALAGNACIIAPQSQLPRAKRPPQRSAVIRVPAGAWNMCDESASRAPVGVVMRSLMPRVAMPPLGQAAYALPAIVVVGIHASLPNAAAERGVAGHHRVGTCLGRRGRDEGGHRPCAGNRRRM